MDALQGLVMGSSWAGLPPAGKIFLVIGAGMGARVALSALRWLYAFFLRPAINVKKLGAWGVVTVLSAPAPAPSPHRSKENIFSRPKFSDTARGTSIAAASQLREAALRVFL